MPALARYTTRDLARAYLAYQWLRSGTSKVHQAQWMRTGEAVAQYWAEATAGPTPRVQFEWYGRIIRLLQRRAAHRYVAPIVVLSELAIGFCFASGKLVRLAAAAGLLQNLSYSFAGSIGHNPTMLVAETYLLCEAKLND